MIAKSDFGIGKAILGALSRAIGKELGSELEVWVWVCLVALFVGGIIGLHIMGKRLEAKRKPEVVDARKGQNKPHP